MKKTLGSDRHQALVDFIIRQRVANGMTQADFADALGEYQSFVARLESAQRRVDVIEFIRFAEVLGFDAKEALDKLQSFED